MSDGTVDSHRLFAPRRSAVSALVLIVAGFLVLRLPPVWRQPGGQDEQWYAVPGYTVATEGVPRIPYVHADDPDTIFHRADEALFALPPLFFYCQALFFLTLPPGYGTARLVSVCAAVGGIVLVFLLARRWYRDDAAALWSAGLYAASRALMFPAVTARPDMLCGVMGLAAILAIERWRADGVRRWLVTAGVLLGLGMLTHPFAIVFCVQTVFLVLFTPGRPQVRLISALVLVGTAVAVFSLWLPLIVANPAAFEAQFFNNVLNRSGLGLLSRVVMPWHWVASQLSLLSAHIGPAQLVVMSAGLFGSTLLDLRARSGLSRGTVLAWTSVYLMGAALGRHPATGYWCYPAAVLFVCCGRTAVVLFRTLRQRARWISIAVGAMMVLVMIPGSGTRLWLAHIRHWSDDSHNSRIFIRQVIEQLPEGGRFLVDPAWVLDFYLAGRKCTPLEAQEQYFRMSDFDYDYIVAGQYGLSHGFADRLDAQRFASFGDSDNPFACYIEVFQRADGSRRTTDRPVGTGASAVDSEVREPGRPMQETRE